MTKHLIIFLLFTLSTICQSNGQDIYIRTKEGRPILNRKQLISSCLKSLHKDRNDKTALSICECEVKHIDRYFTNKQYRKYSTSGVIDISSLLKEDSIIEKKIRECYTNSGQTTLLQAEGFEDEYITSCIKEIQNNTEKTLDLNRVSTFCKCQLELVKTKKIFM